MNKLQEAVQEFHRKTGQTDTLATPEARALRANLIMEEAVETVAALGYAVKASIVDPEGFFLVAEFNKAYTEPHPIDFIDGLCDLTYVVMGGACNADIDFDRHFDEVHRANMRKLEGPKRADGKQLKPEGWQGPDHQSILERYHRPSEREVYEREYRPERPGRVHSI